MEEITLEELKALNQEELAQLALLKHQELLAKSKEIEALDKAKKDVEKWAVAAATELNALKKKQTETPNVDDVVEAKLRKRDVEQKVSTVINQLPESIQEQFKTQYDELSWWRELTPQEADKFIKAALSLISYDVKEVNAWALAVWGGSASKVNSVKSQEEEERKEYAKNFLKNII